MIVRMLADTPRLDEDEPRSDIELREDNVDDIIKMFS